MNYQKVYMFYEVFFVLLIVAIISKMWKICSTYYTLPCPSWLSWLVELDNPFAKAHKASAIINILPMKTNINVLDIGCGPGRVLLPLAQKIASLNGHVTAVDIQSKMIAKSKAKAQKLHINNIDFILGTIDQISINQKYDIILMICVLGEIPETSRSKIFEKISTHLAPNAIISITETIFDPHYQNHKSVLILMKNAGYEETKYTGNWLAYTAHFKKIDL